MNKKNIFLVSCVFPPEPVVSATLSYDLATYLAEEHNVTVLSPPPTRPAGYDFSELQAKMEENFAQVEVQSYTSPASKILPRFKESYDFGKKVAQYISKNNRKIDVLYMNTWPLASQYLIAKTCLQFNIPYIIHVQDIYPESLTNKLAIGKGLIQKLLLPFDRFVLSKAKKVITISEGMKSYLLTTRDLHESHVGVVFNWQKVSEPTIPIVKNKKFTFMFLGSLSPSAQIESIISSFGSIADKRSQLIIAGSGSEELRLKELANTYSNAAISFVKATAAEVADLQAQADVLVLSLRTGVGKLALPSKLISYMYSKKPILAIIENDCDIERIIHQANCGWIVEQDNNDQIQLVMKKIIESEIKLLTQKGNNAQSFYFENFTKKRSLKRLSDFISK